MRNATKGRWVAAGKLEIAPYYKAKSVEDARSGWLPGSCCSCRAEAAAAAEDREQQRQNVNGANRQHSSGDEFRGGSICGGGSVHSRV